MYPTAVHRSAIKKIMGPHAHAHGNYKAERRMKVGNLFDRVVSPSEKAYVGDLLK